jgi:hypothetical protein
MFRSKRFITLILLLIVFIIGISLGADPVSLGTGLTILTAPYLASQTIRSSSPKIG